MFAVDRPFSSNEETTAFLASRRRPRRTAGASRTGTRRHCWSSDLTIAGAEEPQWAYGSLGETEARDGEEKED